MRKVVAPFPDSTVFVCCKLSVRMGVESNNYVVYDLWLQAVYG